MHADDLKYEIEVQSVSCYGKAVVIGWFIFTICTLLRVDIISQILITVAFFGYLMIFD
jgi:hypothetical protein